MDEANLRVIVNKDTGNASWQVWHDLAYAGPRKDVGVVRYLAGGATRTAQPVVLEHWLDQCAATAAQGQCRQLNRISFKLPERHAREIAGNHMSGSREPWMLRFKDRNGGSVTVSFAPAEVAGLLRVYENWRKEAW